MIHFVIGTRAQLFKMAPIMLECERRGLKWRWIYTAQHKDTFENTLKVFGLPKPHYVLFEWDTEAKTMKKLWYWLFRILIKLPEGKSILDGYTGKKSIVLTHGDTLTTWWGALLGRLYGCRVMHVESGLRSFNIFKPFPEEINRLITFRLSNIYAAPGDWAMENLKKYKGVKINTKQNTQIDVLRLGLKKHLRGGLNLEHKKYAVASIHRYENIFKETQFEFIIKQIIKASERTHIYWVQHPATKEQLKKIPYLQAKLISKNITLLERLEYLQFLKLIKNSQYVITDGGGNQEELYFLGKPTLIFRKETERKEGLGFNAILSELDATIINNFLENYDKYKMKNISNNVSPSAIIVDYLEREKYGLIK